MVPIFDDRSSARTPQTIAFKLLVAAVGAIMAGGIAAMFAPAIGETFLFKAVYAVATLVIAGASLTLLAARMSSPKVKRALNGLDLYSVIDRLVDDLDDDEAAYLRRRLDEREDKAKNDLTVSLDDLLDQRAQDRQSRSD